MYCHTPKSEFMMIAVSVREDLELICMHTGLLKKKRLNGLCIRLCILVFQFMKFVKKIGDGEITIKDNQVVEKSIDERAEDWVSDFRTSEVTKNCCCSRRKRRCMSYRSNIHPA